jgi:hypothetical protein
MPEAPAEEGNGSANEAVLTVLREAIGDNSIISTDDFYLVGGHSLLIVRVVRRLHKEYGLILDFRQFAINSRIEAIIQACRRADDVSG